MAFNPSPKVSDCRDLARKWGKDQIIILAIDANGGTELVTFGRDAKLCNFTWELGKVAHDALQAEMKHLCEIAMQREKQQPTLL